MTCPDDPAAARRMLAPPDHLEPHVGVTESDVGRYKRIIESLRLELAARRFAHPEEQWHPPNEHHNGILTYNGVEMFDG